MFLFSKPNLPHQCATFHELIVGLYRWNGMGLLYRTQSGCSGYGSGRASKANLPQGDERQSPTHRLSREAHNGVSADGGVRHVSPDVVHDPSVSAMCVAPPAGTLLLQTFSTGQPKVPLTPFEDSSRLSRLNRL